ncbi:terminase small subunit [Staphylococcus hominis]|uniref:terminase small subunit n=1 Tax=Staphylococcus hominis TaxID=1290 RepID=UPI001F56564C|nr:terminase small subunit [Staphylococcus hominis]MCI2869465.1 terminase small subunit [Staphylococcus hominis]MDS3893812.1 terminase small subunit [Staphylococcus hominis]
MTKLTRRQELFIEEYLIDLNATQAAIRAGYSQKTARSQGQRMLTKVDIQKAISERMEEKKSDIIMKQDEILERLTSQARREEKDYQVMLSENLVKNDKGSVIGVERKPEVVEVPTQNKDAIKALETLGKYYTMWTDKTVTESTERIQIVNDLDD